MIRRLIRIVAGGLAAAFLLDRWLRGLSVDAEGRPARPPIRTGVDIDAPIDEVWAVLADIERQPVWMTDMKAVRVITRGPVGIGTRADGDIRILGIRIPDPVEIIEFDPPHRFAIRHTGLFKGHGLITLDTLDGGRRTRVAWAEVLVPPILPSLGALVQAPILGRIFQADLDRLASLVEAETDAVPVDAQARAAGGGADGLGATDGAGERGDIGSLD